MFIEVLDRIGEVKARLRIEGDAFTVGRAYDNDLILDDPYVAAYHLRVSRLPDGALEASDLGTKNGLYALDPSRRVSTFKLGRETRVRIGHTQLRFRDAEYKVGEELEARPANAGIRNAALFCFAFGVTALLLAADSYLSNFENSKPIQIVGPVLAVLFVTMVWAGLWTFVGKLSRRRANLYAHATTALIAVVALSLTRELSGYLEFSISSIVGQVATVGTIAAIVAAVLYRHLRLVSRISARRAVGIAALAVGVLLGSGWLVQYSASFTYSTALDYDGNLKAPAFKLSPAMTPAAFDERAQDLRHKIDALREEK